ncbi:hypothetical protein [Paracoccus sp. SCSIO 75233]|uniref:hypothetical protein n=1 Tax=Paracoccus sp. SCSIO 75233 TaxID=3017782 RepID=UPI0022F111E4|nr:hypothetical protein [Paracoccus sp. SCSIO 75233]WBU53578.1 hypothetical protein PAF12_01695 [Paracoccus sp. SCSIO 75233]
MDIKRIYQAHRFEGKDPPEIYRCFNNADADNFDFNKGGRLYGKFQEMSRNDRQKIRIDGEPVTELDLKASHLSILYAWIHNAIPERDPYVFEGLPRPVVKLVITAMIGKGENYLNRWPQKGRQELSAQLKLTPQQFSRKYPIQEVQKRILKRHSVLHQLEPGTLDWADLQFTESKVLIGAILRLGKEHDIAALPVHDSLIVRQDQAELAEQMFSDSFLKIVGTTPTITRK